MKDNKDLRCPGALFPCLPPLPFHLHLLFSSIPGSQEKVSVFFCASFRLSKDTPPPHFLPHTFLTSQELAFNNGHYLDYCFKCLHLWGTLTSASEQVQVFPVKNKMKWKLKIKLSLVCYLFTAMLYFSKKKRLFSLIYLSTDFSPTA